MRYELPAEFKTREYLFGRGRRKTSVAIAKLYKNGKGTVLVNGVPFEVYFTTVGSRNAIKAPLVAVGQDDKVDMVVDVSGGGKSGQGDAAKLAISRALLLLNPLYRANLKKSGHLTRDARRKERKKPGLKRARKAPRWSKR